MFTIKIRSAPGREDSIEELYEASSIVVVRTGDIYKDGIYLDPEFGEVVPKGEGAEPIRSAKHIVLFGHEQTESGKRRQGGRAYVMNETGSTVAVYDL